MRVIAQIEGEQVRKHSQRLQFIWARLDKKNAPVDIAARIQYLDFVRQFRMRIATISPFAHDVIHPDTRYSIRDICVIMKVVIFTYEAARCPFD